MRLMTVLGTRPEIIRLSRVIPILDEHADHLLVHTGQNFDPALSDVFFSDLGVRPPDLHLGVRAAGFGDQAGQIIAAIDDVLDEHRPDRLLVLGDTNSGLTAIVAKRMGIEVFHMEAGNRCFDDRVPEEVNRRIIDHSSSVLMPYTHRSKQNLLAEGISGERIHVTGNPIKQVMDHYADRIAASTALVDLGLTGGRYFLATIHRAENVDDEATLRRLIEALAMLTAKYGLPVITSLHPRTRDRVEAFGLDLDRAGLRFLEPLGFFDFVRLERDAFCILTDSGTVQEEACIMKLPNVTLREVTERPETIDVGSNVLAGSDPATIGAMVELVTSHPPTWEPPAEYLASDVAGTVARIVLGHRLPERGSHPVTKA